VFLTILILTKLLHNNRHTFPDYPTFTERNGELVKLSDNVLSKALKLCSLKEAVALRTSKIIASLF